MNAVLVRNAERMMTSATLVHTGIECTFADRAAGCVPFDDLPEIADRDAIATLELPSAYEIVVTLSDGARVEIPWDFVRHYCDTTYRPTIEAIALSARNSLGARIRRQREAAGLTQQQLADRAHVGRVTLVRLENGGQTPRFATLRAIAKAMGVDVDTLLVG